MFGPGEEVAALGIVGSVLVVFVVSVAFEVGWLVLAMALLLRLAVKFFLVSKVCLGLGGGRPT
jgi:hypothetical protein